MRNELALMDRAFLVDEHVRETFLEILNQRGNVAPILRTMHEVGLLGKYIPSLGNLPASCSTSSITNTPLTNTLWFARNSSIASGKRKTRRSTSTARFFKNRAPLSTLSGPLVA